jgi:hypothetical protein
MRTATLAICTVVLAITALVISHWIVEAHRYDIIAVGAGSGGSQDTAGTTEFRTYLLDHKTGMTWTIFDPGMMKAGEFPLERWSCKQVYPGDAESESGCERK